MIHSEKSNRHTDFNSVLTLTHILIDVNYSNVYYDQIFATIHFTSSKTLLI